MKLFTAILTAGASVQVFASASLENATITPLGLTGNDLVYDSTRNVLYMSVPSAAAFPYGNSIVTIDPASGKVLHSSFIGSEPDKLEISRDGSRVYVGVDGANSFSWWEPATDTVGPLAQFSTRFGFGPYKAADFAIAPDDPHAVVVSKDDVLSTAAGDLELFRNDVSIQEMNLVYGAESICFSDSSDLVGYNSYTTGYDLWKWSFSGTNLTQTQDAAGVIAGAREIKAVDGMIFSDNGKVVSTSALSLLGTFSGVPSSASVEPMPGMNIVYFLGGAGWWGSSTMTLASFDRNTFLPLDSKTFTNTLSGSIRSLMAAGKDASGSLRLAFIQSNGSAGVITITPPPFKIGGFQSDGSTSRFDFPTDIGQQYQVQRSMDLHTWTSIITNTATRYRTTVTFNTTPAAKGEFYRIVSN